MPHGARTRLAALILLLGVGGASAEPAAGTTWTDPPTHKPAAETAPARRETPAAPAPTAHRDARRGAACPRRAQDGRCATPARSGGHAQRGPAGRDGSLPRRAAALVAARPRRICDTAGSSPSRRLPRPPEGDARYRATATDTGYGAATPTSAWSA